MNEPAGEPGSRIRNRVGWIARWVVFLPCALTLNATTLYVNGNLNTDPPPDGLTWATALNTVQAGIDTAESGDEVWVAATNYLENITLKAGVALYGGFRGDETARDQRDWANHIMVLDGRQAGSVVVVEEGATNTTRVDRFTIRKGSALNGGSSNILVANNLIAFGSSGIKSASSAKVPVLRNNCVFGNATNDYMTVPDPTGSNGNLSVDPLLVDIDGDFHLAPGSPCIDAGDDTVVSPSWVDLDGQVRIAGPHVDIGADEFGSRRPFTLRLLSGTGGTNLTLHLDGEPGHTYVFEQSLDFTEWAAFSTNLATNGTVTIEPVPTGTTGPQFYRGVTGR